MYVIFFSLVVGVVADGHIEPEAFQVASLLNSKTNQANEGNILLRENTDGSSGDFRGVCALVTDETAKVACKMLGYSDGKASTTDGQFGPTFFPMYQSIECTGAEDSLYECTPIAVAAAGVCDGGEKGAGIVCGKAECITGGYKTLTDNTRSTSYVSGSNWKCDKDGVATVSSDWMGNEWYRFDGDAGKILAQQSPVKRSCGTNVAGWSPTEITGLAVGETSPLAICYGAKDDSRGSCYKSATGEVTNCGDFYVYKLPNTPGCHMRYCGATA